MGEDAEDGGPSGESESAREGMLPASGISALPTWIYQPSLRALKVAQDSTSIISASLPSHSQDSMEFGKAGDNSSKEIHCPKWKAILLSLISATMDSPLNPPQPLWASQQPTSPLGVGWASPATIKCGYQPQPSPSLPSCLDAFQGLTHQDPHSHPEGQSTLLSFHKWPTELI